MALNPKITFELPKRSNVNLSYIHRFDAAPGLLYPALVGDHYSGDEMNLNVSQLMKTLPLEGPLLGSFKVQFDLFECPYRYYNRILHDDMTGFDPGDVYFPRWYFDWSNFDAELLPSDPGHTGYDEKLQTTSLHYFLGYPIYSANYYTLQSVASGIQGRPYNATPLLSYWDIVRNFYANTQEPAIPYIRGVWTGANNDPNGYRSGIDSVSLTTLDLLRQRILQSPIDEPCIVNTLFSGIGEQDGINLVSAENAKAINGGLMLRTFLPDRFSVWINSNSYESVVNRSRIDTSAGYFTVDQDRFAQHLNRMLLKTLFAGGRYSDWNKAQHGVSLKFASEVPQFIGSCSTEVTFEDVVQTSDSGSEDRPLGTLGGRGVGGFGGRRFKHFFREHSMLIGILSIIPRPDYFENRFNWNSFNTFADLHVPEMDNIGFQDLLLDEVNPSLTVDTAVDPWFTPLGNDSLTMHPASLSIGKQPAWTEVTTRVNRVSGTFANPNGLMYLVLARRSSAGARGIDSWSSYIRPDQFNYAFRDTSLSSTNFWVQLRFDYYVKRPISKAVMPHL